VEVLPVRQPEDVSISQPETSAELIENLNIGSIKANSKFSNDSIQREPLRSKAEVKGYISKIEDASFDVTDKNCGEATTISYASVERVQKDGLSTGAKIGIIVVVGVATAAVVFAAELKAHGY
jgi:hypothetical protein